MVLIIVQCYFQNYGLVRDQFMIYSEKYAITLYIVGWVIMTDISLYRHCRFWITSDVSIFLTSLVSHFRNSNAYNSVIYERKHKVWVFIFLVRT